MDTNGKGMRDMYFFTTAGWFDGTGRQGQISEIYKGRMVKSAEYEQWNAVPDDIKRKWMLGM